MWIILIIWALSIIISLFTVIGKVRNLTDKDYVLGLITSLIPIVNLVMVYWMMKDE